MKEWVEPVAFVGGNPLRLDRSKISFAGGLEMKSIFAAAILFAASVQAAVGANKEYANVRTVAVISVLGNQIDMQTTGVTIFGNADYKLDFDLGLDAQIVQQATAALQPQFAVKDVDPGLFAGLATGTFGLPRRLPSVPKVEGVDAYVVILPSEQTELVDFHGLVVSHAHDLIKDASTWVTTQYAVVVFDAATGRRIDYGTSQYPSSKSIYGHEFPLETCDNAIWSDAADKMTDEQKARVKKELSALVSRSIAYTMASAGLIDKSQAAAVTAGFDTQGDPSCHAGF